MPPRASAPFSPDLQTVEEICDGCGAKGSGLSFRTGDEATPGTAAWTAPPPGWLACSAPDGCESIACSVSCARKVDTAARATEVLAREQIAIVKTPGVCGGSARLHGTRMPVWCLESWRRKEVGVRGVQSAYPHLTRAQIEGAWAYAAAHPEEIDQDIRENEQDERD
jgi:uncharacterized protein (DUF433 family)